MYADAEQHRRLYHHQDVADPSPRAMIFLRRKLMRIAGRREPEVKLVVSLRGPPSALWTVLEFICRYVFVDTYAILPILILINMCTFTNTLEMFAWL